MPIGLKGRLKLLALGETVDGDEYIDITFRVIRDFPEKDFGTFNNLPRDLHLGAATMSITEGW